MTTLDVRVRYSGFAFAREPGSVLAEAGPRQHAEAMSEPVKA